MSFLNTCLNRTFCDLLRVCQTEQQREVLSYPDGDLFLNEARNAQSPYFDPQKQLGEWTALPAAKL